MMSALEKEILDKFRQLAPDTRAQMLLTLQHEINVNLPQISLTEWLAEIEKVAVKLRPDAEGRVLTSSDFVNEAREERDADILHSIGFGSSSGNRSL